MKNLLVLLAFLINATAFAQISSEKWDLRKCVEYAIKNNISVKQADVQARISALQWQQAKLNQYPNASLSTGSGVQFGRSIDRTTNVYSDAQSIYQNFQLNNSTEVYNWGKLKNATTSAKFSAQAALLDVEKAANDASLSVTTYYLQVLSAKEQININNVQIQQTKTQLDITRKKVLAGALPELNLLEIESQLATDSSNLISAITTYDQDLLALKGVLNLDAALPFEIVTPPVDSIAVESLFNLQPSYLYPLAMGVQPQQKANELRIKAAAKSILVSKAAMYPSLSFGINLSTNFYNSFKKTDGAKFVGYSNLIPSSSTNPDPNYGYYSLVNVGGTNAYVQSPIYSYKQSKRSFSQLWNGWGDQLNNNFGQTVGFSLSIPIFNNGQYRINYEQSKLSLKNYELQKEQADAKLKQDIYTAYSNAANALQKFNAGKKSLDISEKTYNAALKRYDVGLLQTLDLITNQNNLLKAKLQQVANQYDYIFKIKLLEFYKGQNLKF